MSSTPNESLANALKTIAAALVDSIRLSLAVVDLDNTKLQDSIEATVKGNDTIIAYMAEYGQWVISGRRKFVKKVPIAALLLWIQEKGISPRAVNGKQMSTNQLAFAIQNAIFKNGIRGRDFITPAVGDEFLDLAESMILEALEKEVELVFANA